MARAKLFRRPGRPKKRTPPWSYVGTRIPPEQHDRLIAAAARTRKTVSQVLRDIISAHEFLF